MHPLLPATTGRHHRDRSTRQRIQLSSVVLAAIAIVATIGVFGARLPMQVRVMQWLAVRSIPAGFAGWALYAIPLGAFTLLMVTRPLLVRLFCYAVLIVSLPALAAMGRPRGIGVAEWKAELGPGGADFVQATTCAAFALLGAATVAVLVYLFRRPDNPGLRRIAAGAGLASITSSLVVTLLL
jgi:hypothetical protein